VQKLTKGEDNYFWWNFVKKRVFRLSLNKKFNPTSQISLDFIRHFVWRRSSCYSFSVFQDLRAGFRSSWCLWTKI